MSRDDVYKASDALGKAQDKYFAADDAYRADKTSENKKARDQAAAEYRKSEELCTSAAKASNEAFQAYQQSVGNLNQALLDHGVSQEDATALIDGGCLTVSGTAFAVVENIQSGQHGIWMSRSMKSAKYGKFYSTSVNGNQYMGGRISYAGRMGRYAKAGGNVASVLTVANGVMDFRTGMSTGDNYAAFQGAADASAGVSGFFGPIGQAFSAGYGVGRMMDDAFGISSAIADAIVPPPSGGAPHGATGSW